MDLVEKTFYLRQVNYQKKYELPVNRLVCIITDGTNRACWVLKMAWGKMKNLVHNSQLSYTASSGLVWQNNKTAAHFKKNSDSH
jgi:hypothetical protein